MAIFTTDILSSDSFQTIIEAMESLMDNLEFDLRRKKGRKPLISMAEALTLKIFHVVLGTGTLSNTLSRLTDKQLNDSSISRQMRQIPDELVTSVSNGLFKSIATKTDNPNAFFGPYRLIGLDGSQFVMQNTESLLNAFPKGSKYAGKKRALEPSPFPSIWTCSLVECGVHNPIALEVGLAGEGELTLARRLVKHLQADDLLLADALYGCGSFLAGLMNHNQKVPFAFVIKVKSDQQSQLLKKLDDGSCVVEVKIRSTKRPADIVKTIQVREIEYETQFDGKRKIHRLWTNLMDATEYPAEKIIDLYRQRWEHEGYFKEIKSELLDTEYLIGQTPETIHQEIVAMVLATSLIAQQRLETLRENKAADEELRYCSLRVSFSKSLIKIQAFYQILGSLPVKLSIEQQKEFARNLRQDTYNQLTPVRRNRRNERKIRRGYNRWPKLRKNRELDNDVNVKIRIREK